MYYYDTVIKHGPNSYFRSDSIHYATYDGDNVYTILQGHKSLYHPFAITVFEHLVYWTDWRTNTVNRCNKYTGENVTEIQKTNTQPFDIHMYHPDRQPVDKGMYRGYGESY